MSALVLLSAMQNLYKVISSPYTTLTTSFGYGVLMAGSQKDYRDRPKSTMATGLTLGATYSFMANTAHYLLPKNVKFIVPGFLLYNILKGRDENKPPFIELHLKSER